jgi:hypothetical protein
MKCVFGRIGVILVLAFLSTGCKSTYYTAWEQLGKHKRDLLKDNVEAAREDQKEAAEQFKDALTRLKELYNFEGGDLEKMYNQLKSDYDQSVSKANAVKGRMQKVEQISADLFKEWENEIASISNSKLQSSSRSKLRETQSRYQSLHSAMERAERSMEPVLAQFKDQVLYLKHNLNARAIGALKGETLDIEREVQQLIKDMNTAISQADAFIKTLTE